GADHRHPEQGRLGEERHPSRSQAQQERRVDESARMVQHKDHGTAHRHPLDAGHFDAAEENSEHQPEQRSEKRPHGVGEPAGAVPPRQAAYVHTTPPASTARGMISTASPSERASEIAPTRDGDGTSPSTWIVKMLTDTAVERTR